MSFVPTPKSAVRKNTEIARFVAVQTSISFHGWQAYFPTLVADS
ncbi:MAG: hypothetical protein OEU68_10975 [Nitrospira sp.]|nr:hypothetical protein [Nitrospira sp.]MDH4242650.1 hypothetical protein [Nitrospira sp.]MDH4355225.1 hypothetical protein [Nitrospira sp.]MDH5318542.1 hypothetical protein [Nitrospira sp.]